MFSKTFVEQHRFQKYREFKKDMQIQDNKPKLRETHMTSKARHVDSESENPQFEVCSWED